MGSTPSFLLKRIDTEIKLISTRMSRTEFKIFTNTVEHNFQVKKKLVKCKTPEVLILLARKYGYSITLENLNYDKAATSF